MADPISCHVCTPLQVVLLSGYTLIKPNIHPWYIGEPAGRTHVQQMTAVNKRPVIIRRAQRSAHVWHSKVSRSS